MKYGNCDCGICKPVEPLELHHEIKEVLLLLFVFAVLAVVCIWGWPT